MKFKEKPLDPFGEILFPNDKNSIRQISEMNETLTMRETHPRHNNESRSI